MKAVALLVLMVITTIAKGQSSPEAFLEKIAPQLVSPDDSVYLIVSGAPPCSFKKFDFDQWQLYGLQSPVPVYTLNEMAEAIYRDTTHHHWQQNKLKHAICVSPEQATALLAQSDTRSASAQRKKLSFVYAFSTPAFSADGTYAVLDVMARCDSHQCGFGATCIFHLKNTGEWEMVGRNQVW